MIPAKPDWELGSSPDAYERLEFSESECEHYRAVAVTAVKALREIYALLDGTGDEVTSERVADEAIQEIQASGWTE